MRFYQQRGVGLFIFAGLSALVIWAHRRYAGQIPHLAYLSGWLLLGVIFLLTLYNGRKKIPFLPLLTSEAWLQFHIYAGLLTGTLFLAHVSYKLPTGWFQGTLAWLYVLVMLSGFFGLLISRDIPRRLTTRGGEVIFERIPAIRLTLRQEMEKLALQSVSQSKSGTIADFYWRELNPFFLGPKNFAEHLFESRGPLNRLLARIREINRFLNQEERNTMEKISALVRQKDGLDYHYAHQLLLKLWLFTHIPLTYSLLLFTFAHIVLVFAFSGGAQ